MKKIALLTALLMLALSLAACGGQTNDPQNTTAAPAGNEETTAAVNQGECEHQYATEVLSEATCTEKGTIKYTCTLCGDNRTEETASYGHEGTGANCVEPSFCTSCGEIAEEAWGHVDENGICKNCGVDMKEAETATPSPIPEVTEDPEATEGTEATEATEETEEEQ